MRPTLIALAGPSRSGKGTCASVFTDGAQAMGLTVCERQLSGPGKQYVASAWKPDITEEEAIAWFDEMKNEPDPVQVVLGTYDGDREETWSMMTSEFAGVSLQRYLQRMLQGARDRWGKDFWTDKLIPLGRYTMGSSSVGYKTFSHWHESFRVPAPIEANPGRQGTADLCLISDLRQESEAERVKELGGYIIEMQRPELEHSYVTGSDHVTEQRLSDLRPDLVDYVIKGHAQHNDETFDLLKSDCVKAWHNFARPIIERNIAA
jgi:hypothetical protein